MAPISIVGCGPGGVDHLTPAARRVVEQAEVLVGAARLLEMFAAVQAERIPVGREIEAVLDRIGERLDRRIVVLVSGDPGLCSLARPVLRRFGREACRVVPGISSVQAAFARLGLDWLDARVLSAHPADPVVDARSLRDVPVVAVLMGRREAVPWLSRLARDLDPRRIFVCHDLTLDSERVCEVDVDEIEEAAVGSRVVVVLANDAAWALERF